VTDRRKPADLFGKMLEQAAVSHPSGSRRRPSTSPAPAQGVAEHAPRG